MTTDPSWLSLLPPALAIGLAVWTKQVFVSLGGGLWLAWTLLGGGDPLVGLGSAVDASISVLGAPGDAYTIVFTLGIGALIASIDLAGAVPALVSELERRRWVDSSRRAQFVAFAMGVVIFIESNITILVAGAVGKPLSERYRYAPEKLAYIIDSTAAPICVLLPLNAWGAYNVAMLQGLGVNDALTVLLRATVLNFYAILAVLLVLVTIIWRMDLGPMAAAERKAAEAAGGREWVESRRDGTDRASRGHTPPSALEAILPLVVMVTAVPIGLLVTGDGDPLAGSGSKSVMWGVLSGLTMSWGLSWARGRATIDTLIRSGMDGSGRFLPLAVILMLAIALGDATEQLGTGVFLAERVGDALPPWALLPTIFVAAGAAAFSTGTSWGTFAIMLPIAVTGAASLGLEPAPLVAAVLSGGIFGDHCSPISDTTVVASMAAGSDHLEHVRTQLPYALVGGVGAALCFAALGASLG